jgi:hypothetical protein
MKVLSKGLQGGKVILNPEDPIELVRQSPRKGAGVVLHFQDMVVSTEPMTPHDAIFDMAGISEVPFTPGEGLAKDHSHRAAMNMEGISVDVWMTEPSEEFPYSKEAMDDLLEYLENHRRLGRMPQSFEFEVLILDDAGAPAYSYTRKGLAILDHMGKREKLIDFPAPALSMS